jgi:hypothetical protein
MHAVVAGRTQVLAPLSATPKIARLQEGKDRNDFEARPEMRLKKKKPEM